MEQYFLGGRILKLVVGDITRIPADAIVNAANSALIPGSAVVTAAGELPARFVFHTVGPVYRDGNHGEPELLASCYRTCLSLPAERNTASISFPSISTGAFRYPISEASTIAIREISRHLEQESSALREVKIVLFTRDDYRVYASRL